MEIYALKGHRVICKHTDLGYQFQIDKARKYLEIGKEYTVECTEVMNERTDVELQEIPGVQFNSTCFDDVESQSEADSK